jgi:hypothetical protein
MQTVFTVKMKTVLFYRLICAIHIYIDVAMSFSVFWQKITPRR